MRKTTAQEEMLLAEDRARKRRELLVQTKKDLQNGYPTTSAKSLMQPSMPQSKTQSVPPTPKPAPVPKPSVPQPAAPKPTEPKQIVSQPTVPPAVTAAPSVPKQPAAPTPNVRRTNPDILNANKQKASNDIWGTNKTIAPSPLQQPAPPRAAAAKISSSTYTNPTTSDILKPKAKTPAADVPVSTAPVSNRTALFGAADTPDLTLTAKKLEQMGDLYREFSPQQRTLLEEHYKDDPASLDVIRGRTTGNDWLLAQSRAAQQREQARAAVAAQRKAQAARQLALDPTVQADARRSGEILITPGAGKAVTQNTQPAHYSTEMFRADPRRAEIAAERKEQALNEMMQDPAARNTAMLGRELVTMPGSLKDVTTEANKKVINDMSDFVLDILQLCFPKATKAELRDDLLHYDLNNRNENVTLDSHWFSAYKGVPVVRMPDAISSFSFGIIGLDTDYANEKTLNHEYGHTQQLLEQGLIEYTLGVAVPSLVTWLVDYYTDIEFSYYDAPWEAEADRYGGVKRAQSEPWADEWYQAYELYHDYIFPYAEAVRKKDSFAQGALLAEYMKKVSDTYF